MDLYSSNLLIVFEQWVCHGSRNLHYILSIVQLYIPAQVNKGETLTKQNKKKIFTALSPKNRGREVKRYIENNRYKHLVLQGLNGPLEQVKPFEVS